MPKPKMEKLDIKIALNEACFLIEVSKNDIKFIRNLGKDPLYGNFDARLITQAFGNIIKNASESIDCLLYTSPSPRDLSTSRMPSSA